MNFNPENEQHVRKIAEHAKVTNKELLALSDDEIRNLSREDLALIMDRLQQTGDHIIQNDDTPRFHPRFLKLLAKAEPLSKMED